MPAQKPLSGAGTEVPAASVALAAVALGLLVAQQVAGKALRDALFLAHFDVTRLPLAAGVAALVSLLVVAQFAKALTRFSPHRLLPPAIAAAAVLLLGIAALARVAPRAAAIAVYLHHAAFGAALLSGFWSLVNERFDPWTARRSAGRIGAGASAGGALAGFAVAWAAARIDAWTLVAGVALLGLGSLIPVRMLRAHPGGGPVRAASAPVSGLGLLRRDAYLRDLALLVGLLALLEALLDYRLNAAAAATFQADGALVSFFALYHGSVGLLAVVLQVVLVRRSLERLGLAGTLALLPGAVAGGAAAVALAPRLLGNVLLRGGAGVLRTSFFKASYELLFNPLPLERKRSAKALIDVGADRIGSALGSACVLALLVVAPLGTESLLLGLAAAAAVAMLLLAQRFHQRYVAALADSLRTGVVELEREEILDATTRVAVTAFERGESGRTVAQVTADVAELASGDPARALPVLRETEQLDPRLVPWVIPLLADDDLMPLALARLRSAGPRNVGLLVDALLDASQPVTVRRRIPRVLKAIPDERSVAGLLLGLGDARLGVRLRCAQALARMADAPGGEHALPRERIYAEVHRELKRDDGTGRGLEVVFELLSVVVGRDGLVAARRALRGGTPALAGTALEFLQTVLPAEVCAGLFPRLGAAPERRTGRSPEQVKRELLESVDRSRPGRRRG